MPKITCLKDVIGSGNSKYPIFTGFLSAKEIDQIAIAPSFTPETKNKEIANNIISSPVEDWQRPIDTDRIGSIASLFNNSGEFMPNPVLLSENLNAEGVEIEVVPSKVREGVYADSYDIRVPDESDNAPLWILDGQHRISGLAASEQKDNPVPFVLLLNEGGNHYSGADMARIFAQVTTSAEKLDSLHNEWLTYAFRLGDYAPENPSADSEKKAMEAVAKLCTEVKIGSSQINNPFYDNIKFSSFRHAEPNPGGFKYECKDIKGLISKYYYKSSGSRSKLSPSSLARQISLSHTALQKVVRSQDRSVFFGQPDYAQKIVQDAFLVGVMSYLLSNEVPDSWENVLESLNFKDTNWNFSSWVVSLGGRAQTTSKNIARDVFSDAFRNERPPGKSSNLADFMRGDKANITFEFSPLTNAGKASTKNRKSFDLTVGAKTSVTVGDRRHVKIAERSNNVGKLEVYDQEKSKAGRPVQYGLHRQNGYLVLDPDEHTNPLKLYIQMHHYGDNESGAELDISWDE
jgi:hypothetical protein